MIRVRTVDRFIEIDPKLIVQTNRESMHRMGSIKMQDGTEHFIRTPYHEVIAMIDAARRQDALITISRTEYEKLKKDSEQLAVLEGEGITVFDAYERKRERQSRGQD